MDRPFCCRTVSQGQQQNCYLLQSSPAAGCQRTVRTDPLYSWPGIRYESHPLVSRYPKYKIFERHPGRFTRVGVRIKVRDKPPVAGSR